MSRENSIVYAVEDLVYGVNGKRILSGVDFSVNAGEFVSVIGPNGAGKSTLLRLLVRTIKPRSGKILLFGRELSGYRQRDIALKVGYVPQSSPDYVPFTALQFVLMGRYPASNPLVRPGAEDAKAAMEILDKVGLADFAQRRVDTLSGGERQKVFIAAALAQTPEALLLDEPTTFLDPKHQADIREILLRLNRDNGMTVIAVSHDINFAVMSGGRAVALREGRVFNDGAVGDLIGGGRLEELFSTDFEYVSHASGEKLVLPRKKNGCG